jgi:hypothetical protein
MEPAAADRTEAHFELWRQHRDFIAWKYLMHDEHLPLPTQTQNDRARCFCGAEISNRSVDAHIRAFTAASGHRSITTAPAASLIDDAGQVVSRFDLHADDDEHAVGIHVATRNLQPPRRLL